MPAQSLSCTLILLPLIIKGTFGFTQMRPSISSPLHIPSQFPRSTFQEKSTTLFAKGGAKGGAKGFGKQTEKSPKTSSNAESDTTAPSSDSMNYAPLESIDRPVSKKKLSLDPNLSSGDRSKQILREKYGLRTYEEQQGDIVKLEKAEEDKKRMAQLQKLADTDKLDIFALIPGPILIGIDIFLKTGLGICVLLFIFAGFTISIEAWSHATGGFIPKELDEFVVNIVEPNFTIGLGVLLGFSISLGVFAAGQLGSESSQYSEKP